MTIDSPSDSEDIANDVEPADPPRVEMTLAEANMNNIECFMCSGEACDSCGYMSILDPPCEHDVVERHAGGGCIDPNTGMEYWLVS